MRRERDTLGIDFRKRGSIRRKGTKRLDEDSEQRIRTKNSKSKIQSNRTKQITCLHTIRGIGKQANLLQIKWIEVKQQVLKNSHETKDEISDRIGQNKRLVNKSEI